MEGGVLALTDHVFFPLSAVLTATQELGDKGIGENDPLIITQASSISNFSSHLVYLCCSVLMMELHVFLTLFQLSFNMLAHSERDYNHFHCLHLVCFSMSTYVCI